MDFVMAAQATRAMPLLKIKVNVIQWLTNRILHHLAQLLLRLHLTPLCLIHSASGTLVLQQVRYPLP